MSTWETVWIALASGATILIAAIFAGIKDVISVWFVKIVRKMRKRTYIQQIEKLAVFLETLDEMRKIRDLQRCLIFHGHNCGGLPTPGKPYTVRALLGWHSKPEKEDPLKKYNFELQVDSHYTRMLEDVIKNGRCTQVTKNMPSDSKLRHHYELEGVQMTEIYYLGLIEDELIFLSASSYDVDKFSPSTYSDVEIAVERLRSIMGE